LLARGQHGNEAPVHEPVDAIYQPEAFARFNARADALAVKGAWT
jgi:hypothetical protein